MESNRIHILKRQMLTDIRFVSRECGHSFFQEGFFFLKFQIPSIVSKWEKWPMEPWTVDQPTHGGASH